MIDYFETVVNYYRELPTYDWLAAEGIKPSNTTRYSLHDISNALEKHYGAKPYIGCSGQAFKNTEEGKHTDDSGATVLSEVWYFNHVYGRVSNGNVARIDSLTDSKCAQSDEAIWYYERAPESTRNVTAKYSAVFK